MNFHNNLQLVQNRIAAAAKACGRDTESIHLLAVSKTRSSNDIRNLWQQGVHAFGENYAQEGVEKLTQLGELCAIDWHFIGPLQSNKTRVVAENFNWCHTVDRLKIAQRLSRQRPRHLPALNVLLQVNISGEDSKSGIALNEVMQFAESVGSLANLSLRGIMAIPAPANDFQSQLRPYQNMQTLFRQLQAQYPTIDTLSLGMSNDLEAAICAGSTLVRVGTALFGKREYLEKE